MDASLISIRSHIFHCFRRYDNVNIEVTDLKTLSYKIDKELSAYCRNNNTTDTMQEDRLVAAFGGERFHRPPSNAKKDAWIRYVQTCFYKDNLKSILVSKNDIIWKALNLEPPPECSSHIESVSYGPQNSETTKEDHDQQSASSPMQVHRIIQGGNYRDGDKKVENTHHARNEYHQKKSLNGRYDEDVKKAHLLNYESVFPRETDIGTLSEIERRSLLKRRIDADKDQLYSQLRDSAGQKKRNHGNFSSNERPFLHQANQASVDLLRGNQGSDNTVELTRNTDLEQATSHNSLMLRQNPYQDGDTDIFSQRHQELLLGSAHQSSNSVLQRGSYIDLLRERTQRNELLQQQNYILNGTRLAPTPQISNPIEGLSTATLHERRTRTALQRQGESSLISQRNVVPSMIASLNNTDLGLTSLTSSSLLGGSSTSIVDATRHQENLDNERALLLEQLVLQRQQQQELLYQSSASSILTPSIPRSSGSNARSFLTNSIGLPGRAPSFLDEHNNLSTSMTLGPLLTSRQQDFQSPAGSTSASFTAASTAARMIDNNSMGRLTSSAGASSRSLDQMLLLSRGQEMTPPGILDLSRSLHERMHQEQELLRRQHLLSAASISEEVAALQRSARNQAILKSLDERQHMIEKHLLETKTELSSVSTSSYLATRTKEEQQQQSKKDSRNTLSSIKSQNSKKGPSKVIRRKSNMTRSKRSDLCDVNEKSEDEVNSIAEDSSSNKLKSSTRSRAGSLQHDQENSLFSSQSSEEEIGAPTIIRHKTPSIVTTSTQIQSDRGQEDLS